MCAWQELVLSKYLWIKKWVNNWGIMLEALRREYVWCAENTDWKALIFTVSLVFFSYLPGFSHLLHRCTGGSSWVPVSAWKHTRARTPKCKQFRVQKGSGPPLPSVLQVIYCINQPASGKCMGSDYTIIYNTISMKHLSRPIHQSLIQ